MPTLWNIIPLESNSVLPMLCAISLNMAVKKNSTKPVDQSYGQPYNILWALKCKLSNIRGVPFDCNIQQDVAEILQVNLDELTYKKSYMISNLQKITVSCNTLPVSADTQTFINQFLKPEIF